jgi:adenylyl-sulfate kinase
MDQGASPLNISWHHGIVTPTTRAIRLRQKPITVWFTGLSGSGKSTLATHLELALCTAGHATFILDGDNVRKGLCRDLGFSANDRTENIRRVAEVARLMNDAGLVVAAALISPYSQDRAMARDIIGPERFIEVYLDASLAVCEGRDPKGLYRKARTGEIHEFTGVSSPYQPPENPDLTINTANASVQDAMQMVLAEFVKR